jgi:class 3 adenylate cyclase/tetratricopeptide (TPR) repeat protein
MPNPADSRFCDRCGASIAALPAPPSRFAPPSRHIPQHLAAKILTSRSSLEGERKQVTVLFADLRNSLELLAGRDPEEARRVLDPILERMMDAVHRYEGTVNQVMGDGIMALFGAPVAHEDHAARACYAAIEMQQAVGQLAEDLRRNRGVEARIRVGLNSGEVVVRSIGSDLQMDYTAVGQTTHLAARMEQRAEPGTILITRATLALVEGYLEVAPLGPMPVKGLSEPVEIYQVIGVGPVRSRLQAAAARGLTRFVGRQTQLDELQAALRAAASGRGQVVAVVGEAGVGKSRLFWEFTHSPLTRDWLVLDSRSVSYGKGVSYLAAIDLLKGYFQIEDHDDGRKVGEKLTGKLLALDEALHPALPAFRSLFALPSEDPQWDLLDPPQRRQRTLDAMKRVLLRESQVQPLLLIFEDLHWVGAETQALLDSLVEGLPTARVLLVVSYRPEYHHGWASKTYYTQLRIDPLLPESSHELLRALLGEDPALEPLQALLIDKTDGNPFFLEETVRTLVESGVLVGQRGAYRVGKAVQGFQVPATVQAVLAARIDRLPPEEKHLLQRAAVVGKDVSHALLRAVEDVPEEVLRRSLAHLQAAEFLYETRLFPTVEYTFKHALTHEVAYGSVLSDRRRALHAQIVEAIEGLYADRLAEHVERLAHHALRGEVWDKAAHYLRQAGKKAALRSANREAVGYFEQALDALRQLPESGATIEQAIDLRFDLRLSLFALGKLGRTLEYLEEAEALATRLGDRRRLGQVCCYMSNYFRLTGEHQRAVEAGERALTLAESLGDFHLRTLATYYVGLAWYALGDSRRAIGFLEKNVESLEGDLAFERFGMAAPTSIVSRVWLAWCLAELGEFGEAIRRGEEAARLGQVVDQPFTLVSVAFGVGGVHLRRGDFQAAIPPLERGLTLCRTWNIPIWFSPVGSCLAYAYALSGRIVEGLSLAEEAVAQGAAIRSMVDHARWVGWLAEAYLLTGDTDRSWAAAQRALTLAQTQNERANQAYASRLLGEVAACREPADTAHAETSYREAMRIAQELGLRPLLAHCRLGLGRLYRRAGNPPLSQEHLVLATTLFRELGMPFWLARAEAELSALGER